MLSGDRAADVTSCPVCGSGLIPVLPAYCAVIVSLEAIAFATLAAGRVKKSIVPLRPLEMIVRSPPGRTASASASVGLSGYRKWNDRAGTGGGGEPAPLTRGSTTM